jgi:endogenous inhibitor of DNA gyrase (YacG/DUF329 family)
MSDEEANAEERAVNCPKCGKQVGTTPDGESLRAGHGSALKGEGAQLHLSKGVLVEALEGHEPLEVGCVACGHSFTVSEALSAEDKSKTE